MLFKVYPRRYEGWLMPRFRSAFVGPFVGHLKIVDEYDPVLCRHTLIARLLAPATRQNIDALPALFDVSLVTVQSDYLTIRGFERIPNELQTRSTDYAQSWLLELAGPLDLSQRGAVE